MVWDATEINNIGSDRNRQHGKVLQLGAVKTILLQQKLTSLQSFSFSPQYRIHSATPHCGHAAGAAPAALESFAVAELDAAERAVAVVFDVEIFVVVFAAGFDPY